MSEGVLINSQLLTSSYENLFPWNQIVALVIKLNEAQWGAQLPVKLLSVHHPPLPLTHFERTFNLNSEYSRHKTLIINHVYFIKVTGYDSDQIEIVLTSSYYFYLHTRTEPFWAVSLNPSCKGHSVVWSLAGRTVKNSEYWLASK